MPSLPNKSIKGAAFKKWVVESIDKLIDYLSSTYIQVGQGLKINRTPSGLVIELAKPAKETQNNTTGGTGATQDISATVTGGTASISLSGSTSAVELVGGSNVSITGNTNGQIEVDATAVTGMPDYYYSSAQFISVDSSAPVVVPSQAETMWLIGEVGVNTSSNMSGTVSVSIGYMTLMLFDLTIGSGSSLSGLTVPVSIPIPAGHSFQLNASGAAVGNFHLYPTL